MLRFLWDSITKKGTTLAAANNPMIPPVIRTRRISSRLNRTQNRKKPASHAAAAVQIKKYEKTSTENRIPASREKMTRDLTLFAVNARQASKQKTKNKGNTSDG